MMAPSSTTIVFVPGAWHSPDCFDPVVERLNKSGYNTSKVHLPSVGPEKHHLDFSPDVAEIRSHILRAADAGQRVVVVVHSYGGIPANEAIKGLEYDTRQKQNQKGGVVHLFYCCSFVIPEGQSLISAFGGNDLPWFNISDDRLQVMPATPVETFYNDLSDEDASKFVSQLKPHSYQTFHSKCTYAAWKVVPSTYLYCLKDAAIPLEIQKLLVEETAKGYGFNTESVDASHSPFQSKPDEVADAIRRAAGE